MESNLQIIIGSCITNIYWLGVKQYIVICYKSYWFYNMNFFGCKTEFVLLDNYKYFIQKQLPL